MSPTPALPSGHPAPDGFAPTTWRLPDIADALLRLRGSFAFAMSLPDGSTLLAVDRFARRSLCWRVVGGRVEVHERADRLAAFAPTAELRPQALFDYLYFHAIPSPDSVFQGVYRCPPGHMAIVRAQGQDIQPFWRPRFEDHPVADFNRSAGEFRELLEAAVGRSLGGGRPACYLSGGTDSSTVAAFIGKVCGTPPASYSIGFEAEGYDEMAYARLAAKAFGCEHREYYVTPSDLVDSMPRVAAHFDQPFGNSSAVPAFHCAAMARADGITHLLAGDGGDELFGGNARYAKQRLFAHYGQFPRWARQGLLEPMLLRGPLRRLAGFSKAASYVEQARVPMPGRLEMYNLLLRCGVAETLTEGFAARIDEAAPARHQQAVWGLAETELELNRTLAFDWRYTLAEIDLPKVQGSASLAGVSTAFPLLDDDLLAFSMRLPADYKLRGQRLRWFFKEALRDVLPEAIRNKSKHGFGLPFGVWALRHRPLHDLARHALDSLAGRRIVRASFLRSLLGERLQQHPGYYGEFVWILVMLELWLQHHRPGYSVS